VDAFLKIPKASWNAKEREWILPPSCLSTAEDVLCSVPGLAVEVSSVIKKMFFIAVTFFLLPFCLAD